MIIGSILSRVRGMFRDASASGVSLVLAVVNDTSSGIDAPTFSRCVRAVAIQLEGSVAPAWGVPAPIVVEMGHADAKPPPSAPGGLVATLCVTAKIPGDPSAAGWHEQLGSGDAFDGWISTEGVDVDGFSEVLSHELIETTIDPMTDQIATAPNGDVYPVEPCDAVQARDDSERVAIVVDGATVYASNFDLPAYFVPGSAGPWDFMGKLTGPFTLAPGGYSAITKPDGTQTQVFGEARKALPARCEHPEARVMVRQAKMASAAQARHEADRVPDTDPAPKAEP